MKNVFIKSAILKKLKKRQFNKFYNFKSRWIFFKMQKTFTANFKYIFFLNSSITKISKTIRMKKNFWNFMKQQIKQHKQNFNFWTTIDRQEFNEHQMLNCQWMFKYKTNKHDELLKCKASIVICDNNYTNFIIIIEWRTDRAAVCRLVISRRTPVYRRRSGVIC